MELEHTPLVKQLRAVQRTSAFTGSPDGRAHVEDNWCLQPQRFYQSLTTSSAGAWIAHLQDMEQPGYQVAKFTHARAEYVVLKQTLALTPAGFMAFQQEIKAMNKIDALVLINDIAEELKRDFRALHFRALQETTT